MAAAQTGHRSIQEVPVELNPALSVADTLRQVQGEKLRVEVHLRRVQTVVGSVGAVGDHFIVLTRLAGKDFFDGLVRLDDVSAVLVQVRKAG
jgi:hypothetical protein